MPLRHLPERLITEVQRSGLEPRPRDALTREEVFKERILKVPPAYTPYRGLIASIRFSLMASHWARRRPSIGASTGMPACSMLDTAAA